MRGAGDKRLRPNAVGDCPICGRTFKLEVLGAHADACAAQLDSAPPPRPLAPKRRTTKKLKARRSSKKRRRHEPSSQDHADSLFDISSADITDSHGLKVMFRCQSWVVRAGNSGRSTAQRSEPVARSVPSSTLSSAKSAWKAVQGGTASAPAPSASTVSGNTGTSVVRSSASAVMPPPPDAPKDARNGITGGATDHRSTAGADSERFLLAARSCLTKAAYDELVDALLAFGGSRMDTVEVMDRVSPLLSPFPELVRSFNRLLPPGYRVELLPASVQAYEPCHVTSELPSSACVLRLANDFVGRLCVRLQHAPHRLHRLHALLSSARAVIGAGLGAGNGADDVTCTAAWRSNQSLQASPKVLELHQQMGRLLANEPDLQRELLEYIPSSCYVSGHRLTTIPPR